VVTEPGVDTTFDGAASVGDAGDFAGPSPGEAWATDCTSCDSLPCGCADPCGRHRTALIEICPHDHGDGCCEVEGIRCNRSGIDVLRDYWIACSYTCVVGFIESRHW
jgi:hypothetical protein